MAERIEYPALPAGAPAEEQLQQMYTYLYHMAETLNANLEEVGGMDLTDEERQVMMTILHPNPEGDYQPAFEGAEAESLKSLIIKTAAWVKNELEEYRINLLGEYVAEGKFGKYVRNTKMAVDVTPTGITQQFKFSEIIEDLKKYEINAKNYIKTGLLRTEQSIPVYGVAVGKDIVTFSQDGTETYHDENKVAELTADQLTFYSNQVKLASFSGTELIFYAGGVQKVKIDANGVTILNGNTKLAEFLSTALKFYYNGNLRTTVDTNGITLQRSSTKLAEFLYAGLSFYYRGTMRAQMNSDGITFYDGSTKLAELTGTQLKFYYNGTQRAQMDSTGMTILDGNTKLAELLSTALKFYYNGTLRAQMDSSGVAFYNGSTNLASLTSSELAFYQNGNYAAKFTATGVELYSGGVKRLNLNDSNLRIYDANGETKALFSTNGVGIYENGAKRATFVSRGAGFWTGAKDHEEEMFYIDEYEGIYAGDDLNIGSGKNINIGNWTFNSSGTKCKIDASHWFGIGTENLWSTGLSCYRIIPGGSGIRFLYEFPRSNDPSQKLTAEAWLDDVNPTEYDEVHLVGGTPTSRFRCGIFEGTKFVPSSRNSGSVGASGYYFDAGYINSIYYYNLYSQSSRDIKHKIEEMPEMGERLDQLEPVTFIYDNDPDEKTRHGLIYEDTVDVMPEICTGDEEQKAVNYTELIPMLLKEIQSLRRRVKQLEDERS